MIYFTTNQSSNLEEEIGQLADSAGKMDAIREKELQEEIKRLTILLESSQKDQSQDDEVIAYVSSIYLANVFYKLYSENS